MILFRHSLWCIKIANPVEFYKNRTFKTSFVFVHKGYIRSVRIQEEVKFLIPYKKYLDNIIESEKKHKNQIVLDRIQILC